MERSKIRIGIVISRFNKPITDNLLAGALAGLEELGVVKENIDVFEVPGAYEIPLVLERLAESESYDGLISLGCLIKGETAHFEYICGPVSMNVMRISCEYDLPVAFGVLTCYTPQQAYERSLMEPLNGDNNKGYECAFTVVEMIELLEGDGNN